MKYINHIVRTFRNDHRGSIVIESVIFLPALIFTYILFAVAWDAYRDNNLAQKATYAIADIISRERGTLDTTSQAVMLSYVRAFAYMAEIPTPVTLSTMRAAPVAIRITSVLFEEAETSGGENSVKLQFSFTSSSGQLPAYTASSLQGIVSKIPALQDGDNIIIVESRVIWTPLLNAEDATDLVNYKNNRTSAADNSTWFTNLNIDTFTTVRPRFVPRLCFKISATTSGCDL